ncbi:putative amp-CoA ligase [Mycena sp. CBHHK59/15]|nr:putative amp-CoA ligase [Mycena sp. CBHHK59/15]
MATNSQNHFLSLIQPVLQKRASKLVFKPYLGATEGWGNVTCQTFNEHISSSFRHWGNYLSGIGLAPHDVVGVWLTGKKYTDLINILGLCSAGYVPQLFSVVFPNSDVIWDLLSASNAKALILDDTFSSNAERAPVPTSAALTIADLENSNGNAEYEIAAVSQDDIALVVHSSGTTSGTPKLIPTTHGWISTYILYRYSVCQGNLDGENVFNTIGSLAHVGSFTCEPRGDYSFIILSETTPAFLGAAYRGYCTAQSPAVGMSTEELMKMVKTCGLNRMAVYATFLSVYIKDAQKDPEVLKALQGFRQIVHAGVSLNREDEEWAYANDLPITAMYATSETATLMTTKLGSSPSDRLLRLIPGGSAQFIWYSMTNENTLVSSSPQLWEIVLPAGAPDSPHSSLFNSDNMYHTGDLFEEVQPGLYTFRGRKDDWLKTVWGFCDTKAIEDNVRKTCEGLIHDAVVVGTNRAKPVLFVETTGGGLSDEENFKLAEKIISRTKLFNERLFPHERINNPRQIRVLPKGTLPRTKEKGNVRRNATEELFATELDAMCA